VVSGGGLASARAPLSKWPLREVPRLGIRLITSRNLTITAQPVKGPISGLGAAPVGWPRPGHWRSPSWAEAVQVAGEQRGLPDVGGTGKPGGPAFQADGEAPVRRHAVGEHVEVAGVGPNTVAPDSVADGTIFGVWISVKPRASREARNPATLAAEISNGARSRGWRIRYTAGPRNWEYIGGKLISGSETRLW
jgi:hypothetical protein